MVKLSIYYRFEMLSDDLRAKHKIRSKKRLDCTGFVDNAKINHLYKFMNPSKGLLCVYKNAPKNFSKAISKRLPEIALTANSLNLSGLFCEDLDYPNFAYGYPDKNKQCIYSNDGYLFKINEDYSLIELFIVPNGRNHIQGYLNEMIDGTFDDDIERLRQEAKPFFNY